MKPFFRIQQDEIYPLWHRIMDRLARMLGGEPKKRQRLRLVTINGRRFKCMVMHDIYRAVRFERVLESFGPSQYLPLFVLRQDNEIWVEYIDGEKVSHVDEHFARLAADFYYEIYSRQPYTVETSSTRFPGQLAEDLEFLNQIGLLRKTVYSDLRTAAERLMPDRLWLGFDYTDPLLKNLVVVPGGDRLCAVDVESLGENRLIGLGVAKACAVWLDPYRSLFFECLARSNTPDFASYFMFVELVFLARWTKGNVLRKKWKFIDRASFDRFRKA